VLTTATALRAAELARVQRRTLAVLVSAQVLTGVGVAAGVSVGAIIAADVMGRRDLAGLVQTSQVLGAAVLSLLAARVSARHGRGPGLGLGLLLGAAGAGVAVVATQAQSVLTLLAGSALLGGATSAGLQARFAATDLTGPQDRARALSVVVWATTIGAVLGPNLVGPAAALARAVGLDPLGGPYLVAAVVLAISAAVVVLGLRPDPLRLSGGRGADAVRPTLRSGLRAARRSRGATTGITTAALAHTVMVAVMVMTPVHMHDGGASVSLIGLTISLHVAGMYALSPVMGWAADRWGRTVVAAGGGVTLAVAAALAAVSAPGPSVALSVGLVLLGLGWSACLVASSAMVADGVQGPDRPAVQGASDTVMSLSAAVGGAVAGVVVTALGFAELGWMAAVLSLALVGLLLVRGASSASGSGLVGGP
jgi:MFS family permease